MEEKHSLLYAGQRLEYILEIKHVKNINIHVRRDGTIYASAPRRAALPLVEKLLLAHIDQFLAYIQKRERQKAYEIKASRYDAGQKFYYLGRTLVIKISQGPKRVTHDDVFLYLSLPQPENISTRQSLIKKFVEDECQRIFSWRLQKLYPWFAGQGVSWPLLRLSNMRTRWGTCNKSRGIVTLSKRLLAHHLESIDYVIMHELCHFIHFDHSARFHALMTTLMPDWKQRKTALEEWSLLISKE